MPRALIVTYPWLPLFSGGVKHVAVLSRFLPAAGWEPLILTRDWGDAPAPDAGDVGLTMQPIDATPSLKHAATLPTVRASYAARDNRWLRGHARLSAERDAHAPLSAHAIARRGLAATYPLYGHYPDPHRGWEEPAVHAGLIAVRQYGISAVLSVCPTATAHIVGGEIARRAGIPWVVLFTDLATFYAGTGDGRSWRERQLQLRLARRWLKGASRSACITPRMTRYVRDTYGIEGDVVVVPFDPDERKVAPHRQAGSPLRLVHTGAIRPDDDGPGLLFDALDVCISASPVTKESIVVEFVGSGCDAFMLAKLDGRPCAPMVHVTPMVAPAEAVRLQGESDVLLLFPPAPSAAGVDGGMQRGLGSLFEYLNAGRLIVAVGGDAGDDVRRLLAETRAGDVADDAGSLAAMLARYGEELSEAGRVAFAPDEAAIARYGAPEQAKRLGALLDAASAERFGSWQRARR
ncbi:MAG: glycosyltransferase [Polaromonas sp.]|nr:glycosyltransferase [Gemmatimonadaceae bacterium]